MVNYTFYKNYVLSKTTGANIHTVRGDLGLFFENKKNSEYWKKEGNLERALKAKKFADASLKAIKEKTGVDFEYEQIDIGEVT